jgi:hypothetical protein
MSREELEFDLTPSPELMTSAGIGSNFMGLGFALGEIIANSLDWSMLSKKEAETISEDASVHQEGKQFLISLEKEYGSLDAVISEKTP